MSTAFHRVKVRVVEVSPDGKLGIALHSFWVKNNLLFRHEEEGQAVISRLSHWAKGKDDTGRSYLFWKAAHPRFQGLVIQPLDSHYCFEVSPAGEEEKDLGNIR